jgi:uncharacterized membrane protein
MKPGNAQRRTALIAVMVVIELVAAAILGYLLWVAVGGVGAVAGCGDAGRVDCDDVLASRWSQWLFLPVALPALLLYLAMFAATLLAGPWNSVATQRRAWWGLAAMTTLAAAAAVWFVFLQAVVLGAFCLYCMAAHTCSLVLFGLVVAGAPRQWPRVAQVSPAALLLGRGAAANSGRTDRAEVSFGGTRSTYRRPLLAGCAAAVAMITVQLAVAPASFTVTAEADLSIPNPQDDPLTGEAGDEDSATLTASAAGAELANERRRRETPVDAALPGPAAVVRSASEVPALRPAPHVAAQPSDDHSAAAAQAAAASLRTLPLLGGKVKLRVDEQLLLGPPAAEMLLVTLFDYTCPHCRAMHYQLRAARAHYGDRLGLILIPVPLNSGCNSAIDATSPQHDYACHYARLALIVWKHNRKAFPQFHDWLFEPLDAPPPGVARRRAAELVSDQPLNEAILDPWVDNRLRDCVALYRNYGGGQIPKIVMAGRVITGDIERRKDLFRLIDTAFGTTSARRRSPDLVVRPTEGLPGAPHGG